MCLFSICVILSTVTTRNCVSNYKNDKVVLLEPNSDITDDLEFPDKSLTSDILDHTPALSSLGSFPIPPTLKPIPSLKPKKMTQYLPTEAHTPSLSFTADWLKGTNGDKALSDWTEPTGRKWWEEFLEPTTRKPDESITTEKPRSVVPNRLEMLYKSLTNSKEEQELENRKLRPSLKPISSSKPDETRYLFTKTLTPLPPFLMELFEGTTGMESLIDLKERPGTNGRKWWEEFLEPTTSKPDESVTTEKPGSVVPKWLESLYMSFVDEKEIPGFQTLVTNSSGTPSTGIVQTDERTSPPPPQWVVDFQIAEERLKKTPTTPEPSAIPKTPPGEVPDVSGLSNMLAELFKNHLNQFVEQYVPKETLEDILKESTSSSELVCDQLKSIYNGITTTVNFTLSNYITSFTSQGLGGIIGLDDGTMELRRHPILECAGRLCHSGRWLLDYKFPVPSLTIRYRFILVINNSVQVNATMKGNMAVTLLDQDMETRLSTSIGNDGVCQYYSEGVSINYKLNKENYKIAVSYDVTDQLQVSMVFQWSKIINSMIINRLKQKVNLIAPKHVREYQETIADAVGDGFRGQMKTDLCDIKP